MTHGIDYGQFEEGRHVNYWELDEVLQFEIQRVYDDDEFEWGRERLSTFGEAVGHTIADNADVIDNHGPELHTYDKHGEVLNEVEYHPTQFDNERLVREHGAIADSFHAPPGRDERMPHSHSVAMEHLLSYADTGLGCPTGMTAAAALVLERFDEGEFEEYFKGATAREYEDSLSAGMFLTEQQGGSDVGATETVAEQADDGTWRLTGEKWFCSNLDGDFIFTLARPPDAPDGTTGLGMFLVPREKRTGERNDYYFRRLKDKLGTISVPTGEVEFDDTEAYLLGNVEEGFSYMAVMLNRSRLAVAAWCLGIIGRSLLESKIHTANREAFGEPLDEKPLMREDLVDMAVEYEAATAFTYEAAQWFDRWAREGGDDDEAYRLMRPLLSTAKYRTGRLGVDAASYATEIQGGNGYINGFVTERLFRDAQVHPIWEGTTNMLALDVVRTAESEASHGPLVELIGELLDGINHSALSSLRDDVESALEGLDESFETVLASDQKYAELNAKRLTNYLFDVTAAALLLDEAQWEIDNESNARKAVVAHRFVNEHLRERSNRGITETGRLPIEQFDAIVRFASVSPEAIPDSVELAR
jgi:acyl-CoA dehydrogenase